MSENPSEDLVHTLREHGAHYVVGTKGQPVAVLLTLKEYDHYLDLLDDEADSQDDELAARLAQAAAGPTNSEKRQYAHLAPLDQRPIEQHQHLLPVLSLGCDHWLVDHLSQQGSELRRE